MFILQISFFVHLFFVGDDKIESRIYFRVKKKSSCWHHLFCSLEKKKLRTNDGRLLHFFFLLQCMCARILYPFNRSTSNLCNEKQSEQWSVNTALRAHIHTEIQSKQKLYYTFYGPHIFMQRWCWISWCHYFSQAYFVPWMYHDRLEKWKFRLMQSKVQIFHVLFNFNGNIFW